MNLTIRQIAKYGAAALIGVALLVTAPALWELIGYLVRLWWPVKESGKPATGIGATCFIGGYMQAIIGIAVAIYAGIDAVQKSSNAKGKA